MQALNLDIWQMMPLAQPEFCAEVYNYLHKWRPLIIKEVGFHNSDEAISDALIYTLENYSDFANKAHLENFVKTVALTYNKRSLTTDAEFNDALDASALIADPAVIGYDSFIGGIGSANTLALLNHAESLLKVIKSLKEIKTTIKATANTLIKHIPDELKKLVQSLIIEYELDWNDLQRLLTELEPYCISICEARNSIVSNKITHAPYKIKTIDNNNILKIDLTPIFLEYPTNEDKFRAKLVESGLVINITELNIYVYIAPNGTLALTRNAYLNEAMRALTDYLYKVLGEQIVSVDKYNITVQNGIYDKVRVPFNNHIYRFAKYNDHYKLQIV